MKIKIVKPYSVKSISKTTSRIYITGKDLIAACAFKPNELLKASYSNGLITVNKSSDNEGFVLLNTSRGLILELKNTNVRKALGLISTALVEANKGQIRILPHPTEIKRIKRERDFTRKALKGLRLTSGSLYSGCGLLNKHIKKGFSLGGISTDIKFANDICPVAMSVNVLSNSIWESSHKNSLAICDDIRNVVSNLKIPKLDLVDISYPCDGQSTLAKKHSRDTHHPNTGDLFIDTVAFIRASNPALIITECTPAFLNSDTLRLIKQTLKDYEWKEFKLYAPDHGEIEKRPRVVVAAISKGIFYLLKGMNPYLRVNSRKKPTLGEFLDEFPSDSSVWKQYTHVRNKLDNDKLNFKHNVYNSTSSEIATITATYSSPKIGSPYIQSPYNESLIRMLSVKENCRIKRLDEKMTSAILDIESGNSEYTSKNGSKKMATKLLGMSVSKYVWEDVGESISRTILMNLTKGLALN